tara:strand:+ start:701 stop:1441 length:741 start_codon:yes stop_codon:yes gene_type:complete
MEEAFQKEIIKLANFYCTGCFIANQNPNNASILNTATFSFVNTGDKKLGITNHHVLEFYEQEKVKDNDVVFYVGNKVIDPSQYLIAKSPDSDLATFDFDSVDLNEINKDLAFCEPSDWPPPRPQVDDVIVYSGFPGQFVQKNNVPEIVFNSVGIIEQIHSVHSEKFTLNRDLENDPNIQQSSGHINIKSFHNQGGFSGTLILQVPHKEKLTRVVPIGIFYEGIDKLLQISYIRHLDYINKNGSLKV